ncbi:hypothetical protein [Nocardia xishanensis]|uniref:Uncharacterized protein n=1 Tax=Nocardia xishanensis TaxID=238964 RepID=A0ABW7XCA9_9NOCA
MADTVTAGSEIHAADPAVRGSLSTLSFSRLVSPTHLVSQLGWAPRARPSITGPGTASSWSTCPPTPAARRWRQLTEQFSTTARIRRADSLKITTTF